MSLLFYTANTKGAGQLLWSLHQDLASEYKAEFFQTIDTLSQKLRQPQGYQSIAVLLASTQEELTDILTIRNLLDDVRIILILPDRNKETISKGHSLYPRFLTYVDSDFSWVAAVLKKYCQIIMPLNRQDKEQIKVG
ncbi:MAG: hypothetical protein HQ557_06185 [Bacteroidetes bacterium]|nr:hypothetical protein [Bacteroidota bacterium]